MVDASDRALRNITVGLGGKIHGVPRESGFDITVASELMVVLALTDSLDDLRRRIGRIVFGEDKDGKSLTAEDLKAASAMTAILHDAIMPTLMQTTEIVTTLQNRVGGWH